ncbi:MAG TPA: hypothetical protein VGL19_14010, partial [Polyangiaceae bacterium]
MFAWIPGGKSGRVIAIAVAAGLGAGFLLVPRAESPDDPKQPLPDLLLLRQQLPQTDSAQKAALERVRRYAAGKLLLELPDGKRREIFVGELGGEIDKVRLAALVHDAQDRTSVLLRGYHSQNQGG